MSGNVVSQSPAPGRRDVQIDPSGSLSFPESVTQMSMAVKSFSGSGMHNFSMQKESLFLDNSVFTTPMTVNQQVGGSTLSGPMWMSIQPGHEDFVSGNYFSCEKLLHPVKRKAEVGAFFSDSGFKESQPLHKRPLHLGTDIGFPGLLLQPSVSQKKTVATHPKPRSSGLPAQHLMNKKMVRNDSLPDKRGLESVRTKMKESLSSALSLVKQHHISNSQADQTTNTIIRTVPVDSALSKPHPTPVVCVQSSQSDLEEFFSQESSVIAQTTNGGVSSAVMPLNLSNENSVRPFNDFQYSSILPDEDITFSDGFFAKDDLLQGNGLAWAFDFDVQMSGSSKAHNSEKNAGKQEYQGFGFGDNVAILTPENVASEIELELFKLFGGVNKKYKEKGRSLLFNLKDRSNPELRERVMSGEISPSKLCSMSAEELASKELSEWRTAKAEELAQMVVLPDTEVDVRRLVRKTHKGEYQVEIEYDDVYSAEVSAGTSVLNLLPPKAESNSPLVVDSKGEESDVGPKSGSSNQDVSGSLIIQTDAPNLMQGMVVDELRDAEILPPIDSLDESMDSLNSEPPFERFSADAEHKGSVVRKEILEASKSQDPVRDSDYPNDTPPSGKDDVSEKPESGTASTLSSSVKQNVLPDNALGGQYIWKGILQLSTSASITVGCMYQSGEKTPTEKWPTELEIMGRVKLDSFEKFVRELPLSRTRAVMVLELELSEKSDTESKYLSEVVELYAAEERVGYAEPTSGVELYLCPPTSRMIDVLKQLMRKERSDNDNSFDNKLIGVVAWRRVHISNTKSPNSSSSHHKHSSKKQSPTLHKRVQDSSNSKVNPPNTALTSVLKKVSRFASVTRQDEDDDVPPGFGRLVSSAVVKEDDDLPEFNFSGPANPSFPRIPSQNLHQPTQSPVDHIRQLIQRYGQSGTPAPDFKKVNFDDDDDDIPEWQPETSIQQRPQMNSTNVGHRLHLPAAIQQMPLGGSWNQHDQRWRQN